MCVVHLESFPVSIRVKFERVSRCDAMPEEEDEEGIKILETVNSFRRLGFVFPVRVFSAEESVHYRAKYGRWM